MKNPFANLFKKKKKDDANAAPVPQGGESKKKEGFFSKLLKNRLGKQSIKGEEILGVELTPSEIRLSQVSSNKANQWVLDKFYVHKFDGIPENATVLENPDKVAEELKLALQKSKINTTNAAIAIPVTSAIIRVVTAPLMTDEELKKAIDTDSLWENLVQLTDNLNDYSIFHQVINRDKTGNTMDILFVASKLSDINSYTDIIKKGGLNAVIIDVKCFALKSAVDQINQIAGSIEDSNLTAVLEFGLDENYVMILYENNPIITDIFIRSQDRKTLQESNNQEEMDALVRRYMTQVKQAVQDFEQKYEKRIRNLKVTSNLQNVEDYLGSFRKNMVNTGYNLFDPFDGIKIPAQLENDIKMENRSYFSTVMGLAFRKLDVFGYYKFVTAVKNINLLPNRENMIAQKKAKAFSNFAFKGVVGIVALIYVVLFGLSFWQITDLNKKIEGYDEILQTHELKTLEKNKYAKEIGFMLKSLQLSKSIKSNKTVSFRVLAQIASAVPKRVKFSKIEYNGSDLVVIEGTAFSDQDILKLISNLNNKKLISQASLASMTLPQGQQQGSQTMKGFKVACVLEQV
ncbi:pilus assembly protein PilM [Candidatus Pelagibacter sp.]|nr:pilus assembly protein PilM [Candidatus Pelagibacter sp.]